MAQSTVQGDKPGLISADEAHTLLLKVPFLRGIERVCDGFVMSIAKACFPATLEPGQTLIRKGDFVESFYILMKGRLIVSIDSTQMMQCSDDNNAPIVLCAWPFLVGDQSGANISSTSESSTLLLVVPRDPFSRIIDKEKAFMAAITEILSNNAENEALRSRMLEMMVHNFAAREASQHPGADAGSTLNVTKVDVTQEPASLPQDTEDGLDLWVPPSIEGVTEGKLFIMQLQVHALFFHFLCLSSTACASLLSSLPSSPSSSSFSCDLER